MRRDNDDLLLATRHKRGKASEYHLGESVGVRLLIVGFKEHEAK